MPAEHYWGAQTQRSLQHFSIGNDIMPIGIPHAYGIVKKAAALVNQAAGRMPADRADAICAAADEVIAGKLDAEFPLYVWQTGSGTQSNMNANEVMANRATQLLGLGFGDKGRIHPNDDLNMGQSSNDTFPTAMHVAAIMELEHGAAAVAARPARRHRREERRVGGRGEDRPHPSAGRGAAHGRPGMGRLGRAAGVRHQGRRAFPRGAVRAGRRRHRRRHRAERAQGLRRGHRAEIAELTGYPFITAANKFMSLGGLDAMVAAMAALRGVAVVLLKVANDVRWLGSGPRCGLGELVLPENEPGSSIMPGKVNPTQCEAMVMICTQVIGEDAAVAFAGAQGQLQLNVMRPIVINNFLHSARILADGAGTFRRYTIEGTELNRARIDELLDRSLMLVTALAPTVGYDKAAHIAHEAHVHGTTLREAALASGAIDAETFDRVVDARAMV